jgi:hypothetical protein
MKKTAASSLFRNNIRLAKQRWPELSRENQQHLKRLGTDYNFSLVNCDLLLLDGRWYVTHSGLLGLARRKHCAGIRVQPVREFCDLKTCRWAFEAIAYLNARCKGFVGYGDADPTNILPAMRGCELRIAETRAVNRALRKAYGIGVCSLEELASKERPAPPAKMPADAENRPEPSAMASIRNQLHQIIRTHQLNAELVKRYAADFCGTDTLRNASREQVVLFVKTIAGEAASNKSVLLERLSHYADREKVA